MVLGVYFFRLHALDALMAIAIIGASWLLVSAALAYGISKAIAIADRIELGEDHGR